MVLFNLQSACDRFIQSYARSSRALLRFRSGRSRECLVIITQLFSFVNTFFYYFFDFLKVLRFVLKATFLPRQINLFTPFYNSMSSHIRNPFTKVPPPLRNFETDHIICPFSADIRYFMFRKSCTDSNLRQILLTSTCTQRRK